MVRRMKKSVRLYDHLPVLCRQLPGCHYPSRDANRWYTIGSVESQTYSDIWRENWPPNCVEPFQAESQVMLPWPLSLGLFSNRGQKVPGRRFQIGSFHRVSIPVPKMRRLRRPPPVLVE